MRRVQTQRESAVCWSLLLCGVLLTLRCDAQFLEIANESEPVQASEVVGWYPTEVGEAPTTEHLSMVVGDGQLVPAAEADALGGEVRWVDRFDNGVNGLLAPMIPGEAVWRQPVGNGVLQESAQLGLPVQVTRQQSRVSYALGPLEMELLSVGLVGLYSEASGTGEEALPDDGFLGALTLNGALSVRITDSARLRVRASLYYLFTENKLGFFFGNGDASSAQFKYVTGLGNWEIKLEDRFSVYFPLSDALDPIEVDELAAAGRYRLGRPENTTSNPFSSDDIFFLNTVRLSASNWIAKNWKLRLSAEHWDIWRTDSFEHTNNVDRLGAGLFYDSRDSWFLPWATYDWYAINDSASIAQVASVGATLPFSDTLQGYVRGSWIDFEEENGRNFQRPGWEVGIIHNINQSLRHSIFGGQNFFLTDIGDPYLGSYWRYSMTYHPVGSWLSASFYVQQSESDLQDLNNLTIGARVDARLTERTQLAISASHTEGDNNFGDYSRDLLRLSVSRRLGHSLYSNLSFQYAQYESSYANFDFDELLLMLSLQWNL